MDKEGTRKRGRKKAKTESSWQKNVAKKARIEVGLIVIV